MPFALFKVFLHSLRLFTRFFIALFKLFLDDFIGIGVRVSIVGCVCDIDDGSSNVLNGEICGISHVSIGVTEDGNNQGVVKRIDRIH